jgi:hypothetical protein
VKNLKLSVLPGELAVWRLPPDAPVPTIDESVLWSVTRTSQELSIVSAARCVPQGVPFESGWRCIAVQGPLAFELTGILSSLSQPLARAGIAVFAVSTFDTDYLLVKGRQLDFARVVLQQAGHEFVD